MSRNKKLANSQLFQKLADRVTERAIPKALRYVSTVEGDEREWLVDGVIVGEVRFDTVNRVLRVKKNDRSCYVLVNLDAPRELPDGLSLEALNAGIFTMLGAECDLVLPAIDELHLHENVFIPSTSDYTGHSWETLAPFFHKLSVIAIDQGGPFDNDAAIERIALFLGASVPSIRTLAFDKTTLEACSELSLDERSEVPALLLAHALAAVRWEHCFLEIYRCVERLLSLPSMIELKGDLGISQTAIELSAALERVIGWRKTEEHGLIALFEECDAACKHLHRKLVELIPTLHKDYSSKVVAVYIYKLRNAIVHYRPATALPSLPEQTWRLLVDFLVEIVTMLYAKFRPELTNIHLQSKATAISNLQPASPQS